MSLWLNNKNGVSPESSLTAFDPGLKKGRGKDKNYRNALFFFSIFILTLSACTGTGHLQEGERLYTKAKAKVIKPEKDWDTKILKGDFKKALILPRANKKILWMRPKLVIYNMFKNSRESSLGSFFANRLGEPPVLYEAKIANRHRELLAERAANDGFFKVQIDSKEKFRKHSVKLTHEVLVKTPREQIDNVVYPSDSSSDILTQRLATLQSTSLVKSGQFYHLEEMIAERQRLSDTLRNRGWYYFSPDNLIFEADTLHPAGEVNLTLQVKKETGERERRRYRLASVTIFPDYDLSKQSDSTSRRLDTLRFDCLTYAYEHLPLKPEVLNRQISLRCGRFYSNRAYQATIYRLLNLNVYKFINIRFDQSPLSDTLLDARVYLTPYKPERIEGTLSGIFSPGFYYGTRAGVAYTHRNAFRGAEALRLSMEGAYLRTNKDNFDFQDFIVSNITAQLTYPRFLFFKETNTRAFSNTQFKLRHETNWFKYDLPELGSFRLSLQRVEGEAGYLWKKNRRGSVIQEINPVSVGLQFSTISNKEIRRQLIASIPEDSTGTSRALLTFLEYKPNYTFTLDQRLEPARRYTQYFRQRFAGQVSGYTGSKHLPADYKLESPLNIFVESDYRQYQKTHGRNVLAARFAAGMGIPLRKNGNIALLDRYVIGGASSVRAFGPRTVGPGSTPRNVDTTGLTVGNYTGNLLFESSIEYRMPVGKYPELAFFVDAGNVWLTSGSDATDASKFRFDRFYRELALGTGVGLRVNLGFFVLRLDLAVPLSKPFLPAGERWVADNMQFGVRSWRKENLNWNFSFGYPF
ncbi:MAG TPA: BamA/TamA family outer membrane protein [Saprospiraceae bacterium]|nr:BamA/TamA family outer membrane protein [Saprospiraceae bacterium]HPI06990.1 BamA/TamA family outer membrane protein [Saprospiraceae bacterium]